MARKEFYLHFNPSNQRSTSVFIGGTWYEPNNKKLKKTLIDVSYSVINV